MRSRPSPCRLPRRRSLPGCTRAIALPLAVAWLSCASSSAAESPRPAPVATDPTAAFEAANADFAAGRPAEAVRAFSALAAQHGVSAPLLFNLGNASFRAGEIGEAVLALERALLLAPRDPDIAANLRQVRHAANLPEPEHDLWSSLVAAATADGWAWLASACLTLACALGVTARHWRGAVATPALSGASLLRSTTARSTASRRLTGLALAAALLSLVAATACASALAARNRGVVLGREPTLRVAPYASAVASSPLVPGELVELGRPHNDFVLVRTADGRSGWLGVNQVGRIGDLPGAAPAPTGP